MRYRANRLQHGIDVLGAFDIMSMFGGVAGGVLDAFTGGGDKKPAAPQGPSVQQQIAAAQAEERRRQETERAKQEAQKAKETAHIAVAVASLVGIGAAGFLGYKYLFKK